MFLVTLLPSSLRSALTWKISGFTPKVVRAAVIRANFSLVRKGKTWLGCWGKHFMPERFKKVHPWQKVNHFPMSFEIGRKDKLLANYHRLRGACGPEAFTYLPETYIHPRQKTQLLRAFASHPIWIVKPPASARGQGIRLINSMAQLPKKKHQPVVVSRYIHKPYLIAGRKFDIRLYVAVTSFEPLRVYLYGDGIVRFASERYSSSSKSIRNRFIHLTNYSVSKRNKASAAAAGAAGTGSHTTPSALFAKTGAEPDQCLLGDPRFSTTASKWSFRVLQDYFAALGINFAPVYDQIRDLVTKTIISGHTSNASGVRLYSRSRTSCYELFGFDVLLDARLKPWLMEVNISPSLKASCDMDFGIKFELVTDLLNLVGFRVDDVRRCKEHDGNEMRKEDKRPLSWSERAKHRSFVNGGRTDCLGNLTEEDVRLLQEVEDENHRRGDFERLFPAPNTAHYLPLFNSLPYIDRLLHTWTTHTPDDTLRVATLRQMSHNISTTIPTMAALSLPDLRRPPAGPAGDWADAATMVRQTTTRSMSSLGPLRIEKRVGLVPRAATSLQRRAVVGSSPACRTEEGKRRHDSGYVSRANSQVLQATTYGCYLDPKFTNPPPQHQQSPLKPPPQPLLRSQSCTPHRRRSSTPPIHLTSEATVKVRHISLALDKLPRNSNNPTATSNNDSNTKTFNISTATINTRDQYLQHRRLPRDGPDAEKESTITPPPYGIFPYWPASRGSSPSLRTRMEKRAHLTASAL
ncbi:tubulin-tyrosine ligase family-domain-containing protein [Powellomyces hirtus]|nr:tubulin-tyrosine ligase family-domain-containing protein [Powellomyces hirtus]